RIGKGTQVGHCWTQILQRIVKILCDHTIICSEVMHRTTGGCQRMVEVIGSCRESTEDRIKLFGVTRQFLDEHIELPQCNLKVIRNGYGAFSENVGDAAIQIGS